MFSIEEMCEGSATGIDLYTRPYFLDPGIMSAPDDYTLVTDTVEPRFDMLLWLSSPGVNGLWIVNKAQTEELVEAEGVAAASPQLVGTGPWKFEDSQTGEYWRFSAVEDHYRKTPLLCRVDYLGNTHAGCPGSQLPSGQAGHLWGDPGPSAPSRPDTRHQVH